MAAQVLDYSAGFPGAEAIKKAGYAGAVRYIGFPDRKKCTTTAEFRDFVRHALSMALVYQDGTGDALGGFQAGVTAAQRAESHSTVVTAPLTKMAIYFAVDRDIVTTGQFETVKQYLQGAASVIGRDRVGVYGEYDVVEMCVPKYAAYGWQTAAWSSGRKSDKRHLYQRIGTAYVNGIACDVNDVLQADWGQHNYTPLREEPMQQSTWLARDDSGKVFVCNFVTRRHVADPDELAGIQWHMRRLGLDDAVFGVHDMRVAGFEIFQSPHSNTAENVEKSPE